MVLSLKHHLLSFQSFCMGSVQTLLPGMFQLWVLEHRQKPRLPYLALHLGFVAFSRNHSSVVKSSMSGARDLLTRFWES